MKNNTIYHNFIIEVPKQKVFEVISQPHHLENWWPQKCSGTPKVGDEYHLFFTEEYDWYGQVTVCQPAESFHIKMTKADTDWKPTTFGFDLEQTDAGTNVRFFHKDWPECNDHFKIASFCWGILLNGLKNYLEKDIVVPFEERS